MKAERNRALIDVYEEIDFQNGTKCDYSEYRDELTKLESIAKEHLSPETQELIELGMAVKAWFEKMEFTTIEGICMKGENAGSVSFNDLEELLAWHKAQLAQTDGMEGLG